MRVLGEYYRQEISVDVARLYSRMLQNHISGKKVDWDRTVQNAIEKCQFLPRVPELISCLAFKSTYTGPDSNCADCQGTGWRVVRGPAPGGGEVEKGVVRCECWLLPQDGAQTATVAPVAIAGQAEGLKAEEANQGNLDWKDEDLPF